MLNDRELNLIQNDIVFHIENIQGVETLEPYQKDICRAISKNDRVVVSACHAVGKTFTMAKVVLAIGSSNPGVKIITTAPTFLQVEKLLWSEIRTGHRTSKIPLGGDMLNIEWKMDTDWFALGMSPKDDAGGAGDSQGTNSRFQGFHGDMIVVIFDEATGISPQRWIQVEGLLTSANTKFIAIGNPTSKSSPFYNCFQSPNYKKIKLSCFDSPNLKANGITTMDRLSAELDILKSISNDEDRMSHIKQYKIVQSRLITTQWVLSCAIKWGLDHPLFVSKVLGEFPDEDDNAIVKMVHIEEAQQRTDTSKEGFRSIGVDPARFGTDSTVITVIEGSQVTLRKELVKHDTAEVTGTIVNIINSLDRRARETIVVDATGIGSGVYDQLKERRRDKVIPERVILREVHFGERCPIESDRKVYANLKAKLFVELGKDVKDDLCLLPDNVYLEELPTILYRFDSKGRFVIEGKDDYKKRTGRSSPDSSDSLALANYGRKATKKVGSFKGMSDSKSSVIPTILNIDSGDW